MISDMLTSCILLEAPRTGRKVDQDFNAFKVREDDPTKARKRRHRKPEDKLRVGCTSGSNSALLRLVASGLTVVLVLPLCVDSGRRDFPFPRYPIETPESQWQFDLMAT